MIVLSSDKPDWPLPEIAKAPACPLDSFTAGGARFTLSGGTGWVPPRYARADGRPDYVFLAAGPSMAEGADWYARQSGGSLVVKRPTYYLVLVRERLRQVLRIYDGFPPASMLREDMAAAIEMRLPRLAVYDAESDTVSVTLATQSDLHALLWRGGDTAPATLYGADGRFFTPAADGAVTMRASGFVCPAAFGPFAREDQKVFKAADADLDLSCRFFANDAWITVFVSRFKDGPDPAWVFAEYRSESTSASPIAQETPPLVEAGDPDGPDHGLSWIDPKGLGQSLWLTRRGLYYIEVRATYPTEKATQTAEAVRLVQAAIQRIPAR